METNFHGLLAYPRKLISLRYKEEKDKVKIPKNFLKMRQLQKKHDLSVREVIQLEITKYFKRNDLIAQKILVLSLR